VTGEPRPVADLDAAVSSAIRDYHRARWAAIAGVMVLLCAAVIILGVLYLQQDARLRASCEFWRVLAPLPVGDAPGGTEPSRLSIQLVIASREAYAGQRCGRLPPADPSVRRGAAYYHIPVP